MHCVHGSLTGRCLLCIDESMTPANELVKLWRERKRLSQDQLARLCKMPQSKISRIETGKSGLYADDLKVITEALGVSISKFYRAA